MPRVKTNIETLQESSIFISRISFVLVFHLISTAVFPSSKIPLIFSTLFSATIVSQTTMFRNLRRQISRYAYEINEVKEITLPDDRKDLIISIYDLKSYLANAQKWNNRRRLLFRQMSPLQQKIASSINYPNKLNLVDQYFEKNNKIIDQIVKSSINKYNVKDYELQFVEEQASLQKRNQFFRVVESLCHYARDWSKKPSEEISPLLEYIMLQCKDLNDDKTVAIVPGSGLGRVAHELAAQLKLSSVHAVEFSWSMVLMNEFLYSTMENVNDLNVYPYLHTYSNHLTIEDQVRPVEIMHSLEKPQSLNIHHGDFTQFNLSDHLKANEDPENLLIVTCFFLDTAENLISYFQAINKLSSGFNGKVKWINLGPLKYGTAAKIELCDDEMKAIIKTMGWNFVDEQKPKLLGYLTDKKGLWQGYYDVTMWTAEKQ